MEEELIEMCRICMETKDGTNFFNIFEHFVNNELLVNLIHDLSAVLVELNDSIPYACEMCVSKLTEFERLRAQIRESDKILKGAFTGGQETSPRIIVKNESPVPDNVSDLGHVPIKDELPTENSDAEAVLLGMKVEFVDPAPELLHNVEISKRKRARKARVMPDDFYCCMCPKTFKNKADQLKHAATEHTKFRYNYQSVEMALLVDCDMCGRKFQNERRLQCHQYRFTSYQQCDLCGEILPNNSTHVMQKHLNDHHSTEGAKKMVKEPQFTCDICNKKFQAKKSLKNHMEEHSNRDFTCPECGKVKRTLASFKSHMKLHQLKQQEPKFGCKFCPKKFYSERRVKVHARIHTGEKPFSCQYCDATFSDLTDRRRHIWQHTGRSPYHCRYCDKMMLRNDQLQYHEARCVKD